MDLNNKTIIITGAASGIGFEILLLLENFNSNIIAVDIKAGNISIESPSVDIYECDLSDKKDIDKLFEYAVKKYGNIDIFIANAGFAYFEKIGEPDWNHIEKIYSLNVFSPVYCAEKMKFLNKNRPYNFVATSSAMGFLPLPGYALYSSTKGAVKAFAGAYRFELGKGQLLQVVYPIATRTNFFMEAGGSPVPFPSQKAEAVARSVIRGIRRNKESIFPSRLFSFLLIVDRILPFIMPGIRLLEYRKFRVWLAGRKEN